MPYERNTVEGGDVPHINIMKDGVSKMAVYITATTPLAEAEKLAEKVTDFLNQLPEEEAAAA